MERLDKILTNYAGLTRSSAKECLKKGRVCLNGETVKDGSIKVNETDTVTMDGKTVAQLRFRYFMLNKPGGYVSSTTDEPGDGAPNVISLFANEGVKGLFPVGRLDKDTTGLLVVTNDGALGHKLTAPSKHIDKVYLARVNKILGNADKEAFEKGFEFKDFVSAPAGLEILETDTEKGESVARVTVHEGKFHQVKRMFLKTGCEVLELKRVSMGSLKLDENLPQGEYRELSEEEVKSLQN